MKPDYIHIIERAYSAFNGRDMNTIFQLMQPDVSWPNGWEGGYMRGHDEVRAYWTRQWKEINPTVEPLTMREGKDGKIEVEVHQIVRDVSGNVLFEGKVMHVYTFENGLIKQMDIIKP